MPSAALIAGTRDAQVAMLSPESANTTKIAARQRTKARRSVEWSMQHTLIESIRHTKPPTG